MGDRNNMKHETFQGSRISEALYRRIYRYFYSGMKTINYPPGIVSFTFDDFPSTSATIGSELLQGFGWRGTYYLAPGLLDKETPVGKICSLTELNNLINAGHEIGNHTYEHINIKTVSRSIIKKELISSKAWLAEYNGNVSFSIPFGSYNDKAMCQISGHFQTIRSINHGINLGATDMNLLKANPIYDSSNLDTIQQLIEKVGVTGGWLIFYTHDITLLPSAFGCTPDRFLSVLNAVKDAGLEVRSIRDAYARIFPPT
jgi:peptidoglycan/xylan/chitin deacetylase (PgdA/CDA1 family)